MCLRLLSSVLDCWTERFKGFLPPESLLTSICSSITQDDLRTWHELLPISPAHHNTSSLLAKYLLLHANTSESVLPSSHRENRQSLPFLNVPPVRLRYPVLKSICAH
jgi:hypothetical protein